MNITENKILKRFVSDYSLPINIFDKDIFDYYVNLYDKTYDSKKKYQLLNDLVQRLGSPENFFEYSAEIQKKVATAIQDSNEYARFIADTENIFSGKKWKWKLEGVPKGQVYTPDSNGHTFLSIDLVKANYSALKFYSPELVLNTGSYVELIQKFTNEEYFYGAKKFRQVIFGQINPARQQLIQKSIIEKILLTITDTGILTFDLLKDYTADEIVFDVTSLESEVVSEIIKKINDLGTELNIALHVEKYYLKQLQPLLYFVREYSDGKVDFKGVPNIHMAQVYKHYFGMPLEDQDLTFYMNDTKEYARFLKPIAFD